VRHPVRKAIEAKDVDAVAALLSDDVVFRSPAVYRPYQGREIVVALLAVVEQVFENFRYTNEWRDGSTTILFFEANVGDRDIQGIDILEDGPDGLVQSFTVMIRPLSGLQAVAAAVAARVQRGAQEEAS
jgi:SnoaL-like protein